jgi:hypothetical protein
MKYVHICVYVTVEEYLRLVWILEKLKHSGSRVAGRNAIQIKIKGRLTSQKLILYRLATCYGITTLQQKRGGVYERRKHEVALNSVKWLVKCVYCRLEILILLTEVNKQFRNGIFCVELTIHNPGILFYKLNFVFKSERPY